MPLMDWYTAAASEKQKPSGPSFKIRLAECHLELHPTKTKIVYCKDGKRKATYPNVKFDFLGYCFRPRWVKRLRDNTMFCDTSTRRFWPGRDGSSSALLLIRSVRVGFFKASLRPTRHSSCTGGSE